VELHLYLEGAIPLDALLTLTRKYGASINSREELESHFLYRDFPHFLEIWRWKNRFIREAEDFTQIARTFAEDLVRQNIVYAEALIEV
jgi:adenosine deaminase